MAETLYFTETVIYITNDYSRAIFRGGKQGKAYEVTSEIPNARTLHHSLEADTGRTHKIHMNRINRIDNHRLTVNRKLRGWRGSLPAGT